MQAADLCLEHNLVNSAASRAYYAMFQAAQVALEAEGFVRLEWSHRHAFRLQPTAHSSKEVLPTGFLELPNFRALTVRQAADYGEAGISLKIARRQLRRARVFMERIEEVVNRETRSKN